MSIDEAIAYFGSRYKIGKALKIPLQNIYYWKINGYIPEKQQYRIQMLTEGKLMAEKVTFPPRKRKPVAEDLL